MSSTEKVNRDCSFSLPVEKQGHEAKSVSQSRWKEAIFQATYCGAVELLEKGHHSINIDGTSWKRNPLKSMLSADDIWLRKTS